MMGNKTEHLLKYVELISYVEKNIAATSLKMICENHILVESYDKRNIKGFTWSLWEKTALA